MQSEIAMQVDWQKLIDETKFVEGFPRAGHLGREGLMSCSEKVVFNEKLLIKNPRLSQVVLTYNKKDYIEECVASLLSQSMANDSEIIIVDDCSDDGTIDLLLRLQAAHPECIKIVLSDRNLGVLNNCVRAFKYCRAKYATCIDGDDYLTDAQKNYRQVSFLDRNPDFSMVYAGTYVQYRKLNLFKVPVSRRTLMRLERLNQLSKTEFAGRLWLSNPIAAGTVIFRTEAARRACEMLISLYDNLLWQPSQDYGLWFFIGLQGRVHFMPDLCHVYRMNPSNISAGGAKTGLIRMIGEDRVHFAMAAKVKDCLTDEMVRRRLSGFVSCLAELHCLDGSICPIGEYCTFIADQIRQSIRPSVANLILDGDDALLRSELPRVLHRFDAHAAWYYIVRSLALTLMRK